MPIEQSEGGKICSLWDNPFHVSTFPLYTAVLKMIKIGKAEIEEGQL
jgi:hypothetical protein